MINDRLE